MAELSYFQKYTQRENHITNNTLLMMRHLYQHGVARFEQFLTNLIGEDAACKWVKHANIHGEENGGKACRYALIPHEEIKERSTLASLMAAHGRV